MTTLARAKVTCVKCGNSEMLDVILATNQEGKPDLDFRPPETYRSAMPHWLHRCTSCGYVNGNLAEDNGVEETFLFTDENYHRILNDFDMDETVKMFLLYALEAEQIGNAYECALAYLKLAWLYDDKGEAFAEKAVEMRNKALDFLEEATSQDERQQSRIRLLRLDILRRVKLFGPVALECKKLEDEGDAFERKVAAFQLRLCHVYDDKAHSLNEIEEKTEK